MSLEHGKIEQFLTLEFLAKQVVEGFVIGLHRSPFHGFSVEFAEHRPYNAGESVKNIDWKLYGRTDKLFVKQFEDETNLRCVLAIDQSTSMFFPKERQGNFDAPNKITFSIYAAAVLTELFYKQRDAFGLVAFSKQTDTKTTVKSGYTHKQYLFTLLSEMLKQEVPEHRLETDTVETLHQIAETYHKRSLVIIFSDMLQQNTSVEDMLSALRHLRHRKHEVILFHTLDWEKEIDFRFENRPHKFIDLETNEEIKLNPKEIQQDYKALLQERFLSLQQHCAKYRIDCVKADITKGFHQILLPYLLKRSGLR